MTKTVPPRLYCIPAAHAEVVAVFRRGPTNWCHVGRWDLANGRYEPGAWIAARLFPRRSDLSPDGRYLCYFAHQPGATWEHGEAYVAVLKLPWLTALHAFPTCGTWTRGYRFAEGLELSADDETALPIPYRLNAIPLIQFANERRRGWSEAADSPDRIPGDTWDQRRNAILEKRQPGGDRLLRVESVGHAGGEFGVDQAVDGLRVLYWLESSDGLEPLDDIQWADWDRNGRLLAATRSAHLQVLKLGDDGPELFFDEDLSVYEPQPSPTPAWAREW